MKPPKVNPRAIALRYKAVRTLRGLGQKRMAARGGPSPDQISRLESGARGQAVTLELLSDVNQPSRRAPKQLPRPEPAEIVARGLDEFAVIPERLKGSVQC